MMMQTVVISALVVVLLPSAFGAGSVSPVSGRACPDSCTQDFHPQCVSLTTDFGNHCFKDAAQCLVNQEGLAISESNNGSCPSISDSKRASARARSLTNTAFAKRQADSECGNVACHLLLDPVCVTYTGTFSNPCAMDSAICRLETALNQRFDVTSQTAGKCPSIE